MLNEAQEAAANWAGSVLLAAPPGSGKTKTLIERIAVIHRRNPDHTVVAVSFTRDSADELQGRIEAQIGPWAKSNVLSGTFHSLCKLQLEAGNGKLIELLEDGDRGGLIMRLLRETDMHLSMDYDEQSAIKLIEAEKNANALGKSGGSRDGELLTRVYQEALKKKGLLDFQDLISNSLTGMAADTVNALPCNHLLLDELQDIDMVQIAWAQAIAKANDADVFGVGDDDQSIFGFRQAQGQKGMLQIAEAVQAKQFVLTHNYRSNVEIVQAATSLIQHNIYRIPKSIEAHRGTGGGISFLRFKNADDQADTIAARIQTTPGTWGILARNRNLLLPLQANLCALGIEHKSIGQPIWKEKPVRMFIVALSVAAQLNTNPASQEALFEYVGADDSEVGLLRGSSEAIWLSSKSQLPRGVKKKALLSLQERCPAWNRFAASECTTDLLIESVGEWLKESLLPIGKDDRQREHALISSAQKALPKMKGLIKKRLTTVVRLDTKKSDARICLSTFHAAKGLEWDYVWIACAEDEVIPDRRGVIEEERRLFYVAMTRARNRLLISTRRGVVSSFMHEAFPDQSAFISSGFMHVGNECGVSAIAAESVASVELEEA